MTSKRLHKTTKPSILIKCRPIISWLSRQLTFQKIIVFWLVYKGVYWVDQSYSLAWAGNSEIASDLSQKALVELLGVTLLYSLKSLFENLSKNNSWPDKPCRNPSPDVGNETVDEGKEIL